MKAADLIPKLLGQDLELAGSVIGGPPGTFTADDATRRVLRHVGGFPLASEKEKKGWAAFNGGGFNPYDSNRNYLPNGGCIYWDCGHTEICTAEVLGARAHLAAHHGMLRLARDAAERAGAELPDGQRIELGARNSDGFGNSFAAHLNLLVSRQAWLEVTSQLEPMSWWASALVSMPIFTGQGKVGSERTLHGTPSRYHLSSRAEFFESFIGFQTTERRPLINTRDEALSGDRDTKVARLHIIFFDANLCHHAHWLKCGVLQILGAMLEARCWKTTHILANPVAAATDWSCDPEFKTRAATVKGRSLTALEHQWIVCESAAKFVDSGACDATVPEAQEIVGAWSETLARLGKRDTAWLARRIDWVLKQQLIEGALAEQPEYSRDSPELKVLDHRYGSLDEAGLYFACENAGLVEQLTTPAEIERSMERPPMDTRAWTRGRLLELSMDAPEVVETVNWDHLVFQFDRPTGGKAHLRVTLDDPLGFTAEESPIREAATLAEALSALGSAGLLKEEPRRSQHAYFH